MKRFISWLYYNIVGPTDEQLPELLIELQQDVCPVCNYDPRIAAIVERRVTRPTIH